jgi:hypothetical protein
MTTNMWINHQEIEIIQKIIEENKIEFAFKLIQESGSGIGSTLAIEFESEVNGRHATIRIPITTEENW